MPHDVLFARHMSNRTSTEKKLKNLRPFKKQLASSSSQEVQSYMQRLANQPATQIWCFFPDTRGDLGLFYLITDNLMQYIIH